MPQPSPSIIDETKLDDVLNAPEPTLKGEAGGDVNRSGLIGGSNS